MILKLITSIYDYIINPFKLRCLLGLLLFLHLVTLSSCYEDIPEGIETTITGVLNDPYSERRVQFGNIELIGFESGLLFGGGEDVVAVIRSNRYGEFDFHFTTDGNFFAYEVRPMAEDRLIQTTRDTIITGVSNNVVLEARELTNLRLNLTVDTNSVGDINMFIDPVSTEPPSSFKTKTMKGNDRDTIFLFTVYPNQLNWLRISARDSLDDTDYRKIEYIEVPLLTIWDTFDYFLQLEDPRMFE